MLYDLCIKVKDIGDIFGSFHKSTKTSIYIKNALINKATGTVIAEMKLDKKYIISACRMGSISFEEFTDDQLMSVIQLNDPTYTSMAEKILESRKSAQEAEKDVLVSQGPETSKVALKKNLDKTSKKKWNQFEANEALFGVTPEFNIDEYACPIDKNAPGFKQLQAKSQQIANEILASSTTDTHRNEERRIGNNANADDDLLYSTVIKESQWSKAQDTKTENSVKSSTSTDEVSKLGQSLMNNLKVDGEKRASDVSAVKQKSNASPVQPQDKPLKEEEKLKIEVGKEIESIKEKAHQDFEFFGWRSIATHLTAKKSLEKALAKPEPAEVQSPKVEEKFVLEPAMPQPDVSSKIPKNFTDSQKSNRNSKDKKVSRRGSETDRSPSASRREVQEPKPKASHLVEAIGSIIKNIKTRNNDRPLVSTWGTGPSINDQNDLHSNGLECDFFSESMIEAIHERIKKSFDKTQIGFKRC